MAQYQGVYDMKDYPYRNRLRELRIAKGWDSMAEFCRFVNNQLGYKVSLSNMSTLETHKHENPYWQLVVVLAKYYGVSTDYLMGISDVNYKEKKEDILDEDKLDPELKMAMETFYQKMLKLKKETNK